MKLKIYLMLLMLFSIMSINSFSDSKIPLLIIESYHSEYPWDQSYIRGIKKNLFGNYKFYKFQMNTKRLNKDKHQKRADEAFKYYKKIKPKLVFLGDDNALYYLGKRFKKEKVPVVFLGINNSARFYEVQDTKNITGVLERPLLKRSLYEMGKLVDLKKVLILFDDGKTSQVIYSENFKGKKEILIGNIEAHMKLFTSFKSWKKAVSNAKKDGFDAIVIGLFHTLIDEKFKNVNSEYVLKWTSNNTPIPPFAFWDFAVGKNKAIGGLTLFGENQGEVAAKIAEKILSGTSPNKISITTGDKGRYFFSRSGLKKYKIKLPEKISLEAIYTD